MGAAEGDAPSHSGGLDISSRTAPMLNQTFVTSNVLYCNMYAIDGIIIHSSMHKDNYINYMGLRDVSVKLSFHRDLIKQTRNHLFT